MTIHELDFIFPFFVLGYGALVTFVLNMPVLMERAEHRLPQEWLRQIQAHRILALVSLIGGGLWSLQNLWFR